MNRPVPSAARTAGRSTLAQRAEPLSGALTLRQLEYFVHAAKEGSINRAAKRLGVAQSAMSRQLRCLEREVGVALLLRTSGGVALTRPGQQFWSYSAMILDLLRQSRAVLVHPAGTVRGDWRRCTNGPDESDGIRRNLGSIARLAGRTTG